MPLKKIRQLKRVDKFIVHYNYNNTSNGDRTQGYKKSYIQIQELARAWPPCMACAIQELIMTVHSIIVIN